MELVLRYGKARECELLFFFQLWSGSRRQFCCAPLWWPISPPCEDADWRRPQLTAELFAWKTRKCFSWLVLLLVLARKISPRVCIPRRLTCNSKTKYEIRGRSMNILRFSIAFCSLFHHNLGGSHIVCPNIVRYGVTLGRGHFRAMVWRIDVRHSTSDFHNRLAL